MTEKSNADIHDLAASLVAPWASDVEAMRVEVAKSHEYDGTSTLAAEVLAPLALAQPPFDGLAPNDDHGNRFAAVEEDGASSRPDAACHAGFCRDAFMRLALARRLHPVRYAAESQSRWRVKELVDRVLEATVGADAAILLSPSGPGEGKRPGSQRADYAHSPAAAAFFNDRLSEAISAVDAVLNVSLRDVVARPYDPASEESIAMWSRAWGAVVALTTLDWLQRKVSGATRGSVSGRRLALALWSGLTQRFYVLHGPLPSGLKTLQIDLHVHPLVAQVLEFAPERWLGASEESLSTVRVRMHALDYEREHDAGYYRGRNVFQLHLAVLAQALSRADLAVTPEPPPASPGPAPEEHGPPPTPRATADPDHGEPSLTPEQRRVLERLKDVGKDEARNQPPPSRFVPPQGQAASDVADTSEAGHLWHGSIGFEPAAALHPPGRHPLQPLGTIDLWGSLHRQPLWLDLLCLARDNGRVQVLPVELEDAPSDKAEPGGVSQLTLHTGAIGTMPSALAGALADPARARWGYEYSGLGVFVVVLVDLEQGDG